MQARINNGSHKTRAYIVYAMQKLQLDANPEQYERHYQVLPSLYQFCVRSCNIYTRCLLTPSNEFWAPA